MTSKAQAGLNPLGELLGDVLARLEALESKICGGALTATSSHKATAGTLSSTGMTAAAAVSSASTSRVKIQPVAAGEVPALKAYDAYVKASLIPLAQTCDDLKGLKNTGDLLQEAWEGIRTIIVLASRSKMPSEEEIPHQLAPHLESIQKAVQGIRDIKVDKEFDRHQKAIIEMLACLSWVLMRAPKALPVSMVKETLSSAEFWSNRIRKDFKGKDDKQIAFCDNIKKALTGLVEYIEEYHKIGLAFNPRGVSLAEAAIRLTDEVEDDEVVSPTPKRRPTLGAVAPGGNLVGLMGELSKRKNEDGSSAATGLRKVTKDQQTWRKEFKVEKTVTVTAPQEASKPSDAAKKKKVPLKGLPIFEYQDRGFKWIVENHTKETVQKEISQEGILTINVGDPKQQVYMYNCDGITLKIIGKFKSLILDECTGCAVVYDTLISSAEVVNCKKIQLQVNGVCPVFTIDKTSNILIWLSKESLDASTFTTSLSSDMNVSFPDGDDQKELPIPCQFVHKLSGGKVQSDVSDLYH